VQDEANCVVDELRVAEGLVPTLMGNHPHACAGTKNGASCLVRARIAFICSCDNEGMSGGLAELGIAGTNATALQYSCRCWCRVLLAYLCTQLPGRTSRRPTALHVPPQALAACQ
jgi:hypothetical protein